MRHHFQIYLSLSSPTPDTGFQHYVGRLIVEKGQEGKTEGVGSATDAINRHLLIFLYKLINGELIITFTQEFPVSNPSHVPHAFIFKAKDQYEVWNGKRTDNETIEAKFILLEEINPLKSKI